MTTTHSATRQATVPTRASLRVLPAGRGAWRVEDQRGTRQICATLADAEGLADRLLTNAGTGQVLIYDAYLRLRTVKRLPAD